MNMNTINCQVSKGFNLDSMLITAFRNMTIDLQGIAFSIGIKD